MAFSVKLENSTVYSVSMMQDSDMGTDGCVDVQVWASDRRNGWEQEQAGVEENQHWAAEETTGTWHRHHLLLRWITPHLQESSENCCSHCLFDDFSLLISISDPESQTEEDCIYVGMVTEDIDVSELVDTIAALGRDIEESGRVTISHFTQKMSNSCRTCYLFIIFFAILCSFWRTWLR